MTLTKNDLKRLFKKENYEVEIFKEKGFMRKQCESCGSFYWTLDADSKVCGDTKCVGSYIFIGQDTPEPWDLHKAIRELTDFFKKEGHEPIDPYPVVARWRDDLDFTIASIAVFQPWVVKGILEPPANPLVIPQPCLRFGGEFNDLDNIGRTGRHLTCFTMFGQHSFNREDWPGGYWMDECIDLNFRFITKRLGVQPEELKYVEGIWAGGGNFGPNLESMVRGLEVVNSVFMQYEIYNDTKYREMDVKTIDVGWGADRVAWFMSGTPTIYEAVFGPVHNWVLKETGVSVDNDFLLEYGKLSGILDINEEVNILQARKVIADKMGMSLNELNESLAPLEALYAIEDHIRSIVFAAADSAIPSNVGGGYNLRLLLRRAFSLLERFEFNLDLHELAYRHMIFLERSYPRIRDAETLVPTILDIERKRYEKTITTGRKYVKRVLSQKKKLNPEQLFELYESRGITPEIVQEIAHSLGQVVDIPPDFYKQLELRHEKSQSVEEARTEDQTEVPIEELLHHETRLLYYENQYLTEADATIVEIFPTGHVVLDQTIFYPTGGGQAEDHGWLYTRNKEYTIVDVKKFNKAVVHRISEPVDKLKKGQKVHLKLDWKRRSALMRHHSAVHLVGGAIRAVLGKHVWQVGADKTPERGRLDFSHWESLSRETLDKIERIANEMVIQNRQVRFYELPRTEAERRFGFIIYQGGAAPGKFLRIEAIEDFDTPACGGTHASQTGELGYIKIIGSERIQDGVVRITLTAGEKSIDVIQEQQHIIDAAADVFRVQHEALPKTAKRFFEEWKTLNKQVEKLRKELAKARLPILISEAEEVKGIKVLSLHLEGSREELIDIANSIVAQEQSAIAVLGSEDKGAAVIIGAKTKDVDINLGSVVRTMAKIVGGGAGGQGNIIIGGGSKAEKLEEALSQAKEIIAKELKT